jgi:RNA polymerase sigma factor (sigma-70 family)
LPLPPPLCYDASVTPEWQMVVRHRWIAHRHASMAVFRDSRLDFADLYQAAILAIHCAAEKHDPARGPLATFAWHHVHGAISDEIRRQLRDHISGARAEPDLDTLAADDLREEPRALAQARMDAVEAVLADLTPKARAVVRCTYGIGRAAPMTHAEIARAFGCSRQAVRQIHERAMERLRGALVPRDTPRDTLDGHGRELDSAV